MTWFRVDDDFHGHPKVLAVLERHPTAVILWTIAGSWSASYLTEGRLTASYVRRLTASYGGDAGDAEALVAVGLWEHDGPDGYRFHDWGERQPARDEVLVSRAARSDRNRRYQRRRRLHSAGDHSECVVGNCPHATPDKTPKTPDKTPDKTSYATPIRPAPVPSRPVLKDEGQGHGEAADVPTPKGAVVVPAGGDLADTLHAMAASGTLTLIQARDVAGGDYAAAMSAIRNDPRLRLRGDQIITTTGLVEEVLRRA